MDTGWNTSSQSSPACCIAWRTRLRRSANSSAEKSSFDMVLRQLEQAVAAPRQGGDAFADDLARADRVHRLGHAPWRLGKVDAGTRLARRHALAEFGQRLEQAVLTRVDVVRGVVDAHDAGR